MTDVRIDTGSKRAAKIFLRKLMQSNSPGLQKPNSVENTKLILINPTVTDIIRRGNLCGLEFIHLKLSNNRFNHDVTGRVCRR